MTELRQVHLGEPFFLGYDEEAAFDDAPLTVKLINTHCAYAGHRFEELGDEYCVTLSLVLEGYEKTETLTWYEREDPPGRVLTCYGYGFDVLGCRTGYRRTERGVTLKVTRSEATATERPPAPPPDLAQRALSEQVSLGEPFVLCRNDEVVIEGASVRIRFDDIARVWAQREGESPRVRRWKVTLRVLLAGKRSKLDIEAQAANNSVPPQGTGSCEDYEIRVLNCSTGYYNRERRVQLRVERHRFAVE